MPKQNSKLANMLIMLQLQRKFEREGTDAVSVAAGPGPTKSDGTQQAIQSISNGVLRRFVDAITDVLMFPTAEREPGPLCVPRRTRRRQEATISRQAGSCRCMGRQ